MLIQIAVVEAENRFEALTRISMCKFNILQMDIVWAHRFSHCHVTMTDAKDYSLDAHFMKSSVRRI